MKNLLVSFLLSTVYLSSLVLLLTGLFALFKTRISARARYLIWFLLLLSFVIPIRPQFGTGFIQLSASPAVSEVTAVQAGGQAATETASAAASPGLLDGFLALPWFEILAAIWFLGFAISLGKSIYSYIRFRKMLKRWGETVTEEPVLAVLSDVKRSMGVKHPLAVLHYPLAHSPMLIGFQRVFIILPELDYTEEELELIFRHELTHFQHHDVYVNLLAVLIRALHWFNPLAHLACKEAQETGELYCDHAVLQQADTAYRSFYGETILTMIDRSKKSPLVLTTCFYSDKFNLKRRIVEIMDQRLPQRFLSGVFLLIVPVLLLLSNSVFALDERPQQPQPSQTAKTRAAQKLDQKEALSIALKDAGLAAKDIADLEVVQEKDGYHIRFSHANTAHDYQISAKDGKIVRQKQTHTVEKTITVEKESSNPAESSSSANVPAPSQPAAGQVQVTPEGSASTGSQSSGTQTQQSDDDDDDDDDQYDD